MIAHGHACVQGPTWNRGPCLFTGCVRVCVHKQTGDCRRVPLCEGGACPGLHEPERTHV